MSSVLQRLGQEAQEGNPDRSGRWSTSSTRRGLRRVGGPYASRSERDPVLDVRKADRVSMHIEELLDEEVTALAGVASTLCKRPVQSAERRH